MRNLIGAMLALALPSPAAGQSLAWSYRPPDEVRGPRLLREPRLRESSGVARSHTMPGVLYTVNDSGNDPIVFATDTTGRAIGAWPLAATVNRDWEAIAVGPCPGGSCIYIGNTGDNAEAMPAVVVYRVREPSGPAPFLGSGDAAPRDLDSLVLTSEASAFGAGTIYVVRCGP